MPVSPLLSTPLLCTPERLHSVKSSPLRLSSLNHPPLHDHHHHYLHSTKSSVKTQFHQERINPPGGSTNMKIHEASGCGDSDRGEVIRFLSEAFFPPSKPLMQYCEEQAAHGSSVNGFRWGDISGAIKEMTRWRGKSGWIPAGAFWKGGRQRGDVRSCLCAVMVAHPNKKNNTLSSAHKQNLHNSFQFFHYSSLGRIL